MKQQATPSKYTEGWLEALDGRTSISKAVTQRYEALAADLGGVEQLSYQRRSLCKRAIWLEAVIEQQEAALARGEEVDQGKLTQAVNSLMGVLKTLGLDRAARDVPDLADFLKRRASQ